jgi:hypothetical protein
VIFLISAITIGCGGYVDNNGNIVESSDAEQDSIFYQNKELTQFDIDVYQYFKKYERDYADMVSFRKDLPGRVILIIDEGSPITPWDILDLKMKEDGRLEFEIVEKNKNGEIKLNEGDILIGWVDRFYVKSGDELPEEYVRWVNFMGRVTAVEKDEGRRTLLVYAEPEYWGNIFDRISLENVYLDWGKIFEEANSPEAPVFRLVKVGSDLEAKSFKRQKRILLKFDYIQDCINYAANPPPDLKYIYVVSPNPQPKTIFFPNLNMKFEDGDLNPSNDPSLRIELIYTSTPPYIINENGKPVVVRKEKLEISGSVKIAKDIYFTIGSSNEETEKYTLQRAECLSIQAGRHGDGRKYKQNDKLSSGYEISGSGTASKDEFLRIIFDTNLITAHYFSYAKEILDKELTKDYNLFVGFYREKEIDFQRLDFKDVKKFIKNHKDTIKKYIPKKLKSGRARQLYKFIASISPALHAGISIWVTFSIATPDYEFTIGIKEREKIRSTIKSESLVYGYGLLKNLKDRINFGKCSELRSKINDLKTNFYNVWPKPEKYYKDVFYGFRCVLSENQTHTMHRHFYIEGEGKFGYLLVPIVDFIVGVGNNFGGLYFGAGFGVAGSTLLKFAGEAITGEGGSGEILAGEGLMPILWAPVLGAFIADKWIFDVRYRIPLGNDIALIIPFLWLGSTPNKATQELKTIFIDIVNEGLRNVKRGIF